MPDTYYPETEEASPAPAAESETRSKDESEQAEEQTALLPKSIFPGGEAPEPGDVCEFEVVRSYENEVEVKYKKEEGEEETEGKPPERMMETSPEMESAQSQLASMAQ